MVRTATAAVAALLGMSAAPALAQRNDGIDNTPSEQRIAEDLRATGSRCTAPACRNAADGVYPPSTGPGYGARTPSISGGQKQPGD